MKCKSKQTRNMYTYHIKEMLFVSTCRKSLIKFGVYSALLFIAIVMSLIPHFFNNKRHSLHHHHGRFVTDLKYILFWSKPTDTTNTLSIEKTPYQSGQTMFIRQKCPYINCYITYNRSLIQDWNFDAVVFDINNIRHVKLNEINLTRSVDQKYIYKSFEPSEKHPLCNAFYDNFFNWTWTYKLNSDIPHPLFNIHDDNNTFIGPSKNVTWIKKMKSVDRLKNKLKYKQKAVAWIGKCKLKAKHKAFLDKLYNELKGYNYSLDIYGPCGKRKCPNGQSHKCYKMIEKEYYFQLVFEDYFSEDYVTETLYKVLKHVTLPIVVGEANYDNFLPPGSYINAQTFDIKKLGAIIDYLIKDPKTYKYFFDWMNHYHYTPRSSNYVCDLCSKLNNIESVRELSSYNNFRKWWNPDYKDICRTFSTSGKDCL